MSSAALVRRQPQQVATLDYSHDQIQLIKDVYAKGASDAEFRLFVEVSKYQGLDIFKKQIYLMKFWDSEKGGWGFQPVTGIDGYRSKAEETGVYGGQLGPFWCGEDGDWKDVWTAKNPPAAAKVGVIRTDWKEPIWAVARYSSYVQTKKDGTPNKMWEKMADNQLAKCAESLALRKAFPQQVGGLYTDVEMEQASEPTEKNVTRTYPDIKPVEAVREGGRVEKITQADCPVGLGIDAGLIEWAVRTKGEKAGQAYFDGFLSKKTQEEKEAFAVKNGIRWTDETVIVVEQPTREDFLQRIEAQIAKLDKAMGPTSATNLVMKHTQGEEYDTFDLQALQSLSADLANDLTELGVE